MLSPDFPELSGLEDALQAGPSCLLDREPGIDVRLHSSDPGSSQGDVRRVSGEERSLRANVHPGERDGTNEACFF